MNMHVAAAVLIVAAQASSTPAERAVVAVVQQLADAQRNFDQPALERLLTAAYVEVSPVGDVDERAKVIGFYSANAKANSPEVSSIVIDEPNVRIDGEHATVIVRQTTNVGPAGASRAVVMRVTAHLRDGNTWRIASTHYTGIRPPVKGQ